jgi:glyoxylase-like metal-dependent hydrolase (beta-lactamase superfamily II)
MSISRRSFLSSAAAATAAGVFGRDALAHMLQAQQPQATFTNIRRNVGFFTMRGGTVGWLVNSGGVVVVDTQFPDTAAALIQGLNQRSSNRAVDLLLNTHHHGDH